MPKGRQRAAMHCTTRPGLPAVTIPPFMLGREDKLASARQGAGTAWRLEVWGLDFGGTLIVWGTRDVRPPPS